jgi:DNA-binding transcriptional ArsR family regulator
MDPWAALGDPTRRKVLAAVVPGPRSVTAIADGLPVSRPAVSQHLKVLRDAGLVEASRDGRQHLYRVRLVGLEQVRRELESFWGTGLANLKRLSELSYPPSSPPDPDQEPR